VRERDSDVAPLTLVSAKTAGCRGASTCGATRVRLTKQPLWSPAVANASTARAAKTSRTVPSVATRAGAHVKDGSICPDDGRCRPAVTLETLWKRPGEKPLLRRQHSHAEIRTALRFRRLAEAGCNSSRSPVTSEVLSRSGATAHA
jgi:hypothetical protein